MKISRLSENNWAQLLKVMGTGWTLGKIVACNLSSSDQIIYLALKSGGSGLMINDADLLVSGQTILANETLIFSFDFKLESGDVLSCKSGTNGAVTFWAFYE